MAARTVHLRKARVPMCVTEGDGDGAEGDAISEGLAANVRDGGNDDRPERCAAQEGCRRHTRAQQDFGQLRVPVDDPHLHTTDLPHRRPLSK